MSTKALLLGLPSTGKSTYLTALYHLLESGEVAGSLELASLSEDRAYINEKLERWLSYSETERTSSDNATEVEMALRSGDEDLVLHIPDLAGERFERWLMDRQWPKKLGEDIRTCGGFLLFVHPRMVKKALSINQLEVDVGALQDIGGEERIAPFNYEKVSTQVLLVDLLQLLNYAREGEPFKLALIISAYDLVTNPKFILTDKPEAPFPTKWLEDEMPLLAQYLDSAFSCGSLRIYGVSAQGGDLKDPEERARLEGTMNVSERVWVLEGEHKHADLSAPVRWFLGLGG